jgi:hypothetical protein
LRRYRLLQRRHLAKKPFNQAFQLGRRQRIEILSRRRHSHTPGALAAIVNDASPDLLPGLLPLLLPLEVSPLF